MCKKNKKIKPVKDLYLIDLKLAQLCKLEIYEIEGRAIVRVLTLTSIRGVETYGDWQLAPTSSSSCITIVAYKKARVVKAPWPTGESEHDPLPVLCEPQFGLLVHCPADCCTRPHHGNSGAQATEKCSGPFVSEQLFRQPHYSYRVSTLPTQHLHTSPPLGVRIAS